MFNAAINYPMRVLKGKRIKIIFHSLFNRLHEAKLTKKKVDHTKNIKYKTVPG